MKILLENKKAKREINNKGITLIALVVTIVVLLILAAVSIATLTGPNGLFTRAGEAKTEIGRAGAKEKVQVEVAGSYDNNGNLSKDMLNENLKNVEGLTSGTPITEFPATVAVDGYNVTIDGNGNVTVEGEKIPDSEVEIKLTGIEITTPPTKITYTDGESFANAGMVVTANYSDGSKKVITNYTITDGTNLVKGKTSVTISYTEENITKTATQNITVNAELITFSIGGTSYQAEKGMNWMEWCDSSYNTGGYYTVGPNSVINKTGNPTNYRVCEETFARRRTRR